MANIKSILLLFAIFCFIVINQLNVDYAFVSNADNAQQITITNAVTLDKISFFNNNLYCVDTTKQELYVINLKDNSITMLNGSSNAQSSSPFAVLKDYCALQNGDIYFTEPTNGITFYDSKLHSYTKFAQVENKFDSGAYIGLIADLTSDFNSTLYALESGENPRILTRDKDAVSEKLCEYKVLNATITNNARIMTSYNGKNIYILDNGILRQVSENLVNEILDLSTINVIDIKLDYKNNVYILTKENDTYKINKYTLNAGTYELSSSLNVLNNASSFDFNYENGTIYLTQNSSANINSISNNAFISSLNNYIHSVNWKSETTIQNAVSIGVTNEETTIYKQPIEIATLSLLPQNKQFIILNDNLPDAPNFAYILFSSIVDGKTQLVSGYVNKEYYTLSTPQILGQAQAHTINNNTKIFKYPTTQVYANEDNNLCQLSLATLLKGTTITLCQTQNDFVDSCGLTLCQIIYDNKIGYALKSALSINETITPENIMSPNAQITLPQAGMSIDVYADSTKTDVLTEIDTHLMVYLYEGSENNGCVKIQYLSRDNEVITGYVEKMYVANLGLSIYIVFGIGALLLAILIALIILFFALKKKKKQTNNN